MMRRVGKISLLAIDESHCISMVRSIFTAFFLLLTVPQWGASFRPEYLKIARFAEELDVERVLCLTATATTAVIGDICDKFYISKSKGVFRTPVYRPKSVCQRSSLLRTNAVPVSLSRLQLRRLWTRRSST
jgi:superfamily II DNA helicase RecQ